MQPQLGAGAEQPQVGAGAEQQVGAGQHFFAAILAFSLASKPCFAHGSQQGSQAGLQQVSHAGLQHGAGAGVQQGAGAGQQVGAGAQQGAGAGQQVGAGAQHGAGSQQLDLRAFSFASKPCLAHGSQQVGAGSQQGAGCAHGSQHLFLPRSPAFATLPNAKHIAIASKDSLRFLMRVTPLSRVFGKLGEILTARIVRSTTGKH
ncbi:MAG: hypothetical protein U0930_12055 [Pirellulales bacterium]